MRYKIKIAYDGTLYGGWQIQPNSITIQQLLEESIYKVTGEKVIVYGASRTDAGVHARAQVAHFDICKIWKPKKLLAAINAYLPDDIVVMDVSFAPEEFHARNSAKMKIYKYYIWNDCFIPPFIKRYRLAVKEKLDIELMSKAASILTGTHDFTAFSCDPKCIRINESNIRTIYSLNIKRKGKEVIISICGNGFLYKMVRSITGHLIKVGCGKISFESTSEILYSCKRTAVVPTAPPTGLFLWRIIY